VDTIKWEDRMEILQRDIRERVERLLSRSGMGTRRQLARQMEIGEDMLSKLLRGDRAWKLVHLLQVATAFGVPIRELLSSTHGGGTLPLHNKTHLTWVESYDYVLHPDPTAPRVLAGPFQADYCVRVIEPLESLLTPSGTIAYSRRNYTGMLTAGDVINYVSDDGMSWIVSVRPAGAYLVLACPIPGIVDDVVFRPGGRPVDLRVASIFRYDDVAVDE